MTISVTIATDDDFDPSERLQSAIEHVRRLAHVGVDHDDEVAGFAMDLTIGDLGKASVGPLGPEQWQDGCWWFDDTGCGWFQSGNTSCIGHTAPTKKRT